MRKYNYYIDHDGYNTLVRDGGNGIEELYRENPVWKWASEYYWREICLGQGFNCLWDISLEDARAYLTSWGLDPELAQEMYHPEKLEVEKENQNI